MANISDLTIENASAIQSLLTGRMNQLVRDGMVQKAAWKLAASEVAASLNPPIDVELFCQWYGSVRMGMVRGAMAAKRAETPYVTKPADKPVKPAVKIEQVKIERSPFAVKKQQPNRIFLSKELRKAMDGLAKGCVVSLTFPDDEKAHRAQRSIGEIAHELGWHSNGQPAFQSKRQGKTLWIMRQG